MTDREFFERTDFSFEITGDENGIEILPFIDSESDQSRTLIASFQVDSLEMIESARIPLASGKNHVPFQQKVRIVKPLLWQPNGSGTPSLYCFSVIFHQKGAPVCRMEKKVGIRFVEAGKKFFKVNGKKIRLTPCRPDFSGSGEKDRGGLDGNLVCLKDSDPKLREKLDFCGVQGLIAALELSGVLDPEPFFFSPGVCIFTAESGSEGERQYKKNCRSGGAIPFLTHDELNLLMIKD